MKKIRFFTSMCAVLGVCLSVCFLLRPSISVKGPNIIRAAACPFTAAVSNCQATADFSPFKMEKTDFSDNGFLVEDGEQPFSLNNVDYDYDDYDDDYDDDDYEYYRHYYNDYELDDETAIRLGIATVAYLFIFLASIITMIIVLAVTQSHEKKAIAQSYFPNPIAYPQNNPPMMPNDKQP